MKNLLYILTFVVASCAPRTSHLRYEIFSAGIDSTMMPSQGHINLVLTRQGDFSTGTIDIKCDSLTTIDSVITTNVVRGGKEFLDISLKTSHHRIIMFDKMWGIFTERQENAVIFYDTRKKKWWQK